MDHKKIVASALGISIVLALIILGTGNAAAVGNPPSRLSNPLASLAGDGAGTKGQSASTLKPPTKPGDTISAKPSVTVTAGAWRNLRPTESTLNGVSLLPSSYSVDCQTPGQLSEGWIVGDGATMLSYCNGVWDHAIIPVSVQGGLFGVQAISPTLSVAVGDQGAILVYLYEESATTWKWVKAPVQSSRLLYSVSMVSLPDGSYTGWVVGYGDPLVNGRGTLIRGTISAPIGSAPNSTHTYDWTPVSGSYPSLPAVDSYYSVHTLSPTDSWAVGGVNSDSAGIIIHWNGSQWTVYQNVADPLYGIRMKSATEGWAVGKRGAIYQFNGSGWTKVASPTTEILSAVGYAPNGEQWIVGYGNGLLKYVSGSWQQVPQENLRTDAFSFRAVDFASGHGWLVGGHLSKGIGGQILEYEDGLWLAVTPPTDNRLNAVAVVNENDAWAVGAADSSGGTIIHWDGKHWQRWYQADLPIPAADLYTISMVSATNGWAAGDLVSGGPAVFLHWDGKRWAQPRLGDPSMSRINALDTYKTNDPLDPDHPVFAWAVADGGSNFSKYQTTPDYWSGLASCGGTWYQMFGVSIIPGDNQPGNWDAWAVGRRRADSGARDPKEAVFMRFMNNCLGSAWDVYAVAPGSTTSTSLFGIKMLQDGGVPWGYATGNQNAQATIYQFTNPNWTQYYIQAADNPSNFYSVDILNPSKVAWIGGYYWNKDQGKKWEYIVYIDANGKHWIDNDHIIPVNGTNIYHRPIRSIRMASDTMGWAVGDPEDGNKKSVIYQYPYPNFTLNTTPAARAIVPGTSTTFTVNVNSIGGINSNVSLTFPSGFPAVGISASAVPDSINKHQTATIYVTTTGATPTGTYCIVLRGSATFISGDVPMTVSRDVCLNLSVTYRPVYSVSPDHGPAGTVVTITGTNFGSDPGAGNRGSASNHVSWGNVSMPSSAVLSWTNTQITFRPPDDPSLFVPGGIEFPLNGRVKVTAGGYDSNDNYTFKMDPWISSLAKTASPGYFTVTLTGTSFGNDPGSTLRSTMFEHVALNGSYIANARIVSWSNHSIVFTVDAGTQDGSLTVTSNGFESNSVYLSISMKQFLPLIRR